jgi:ribulose-phosphate 3-epimerase
MCKIFPSLISADLLNLQKIITLLEPHGDGFHVDVMDFQFVPNLTWGPMFVNAIRAVTKKQVWVDLLVQHPEKYLDLLALAPGDLVSFHQESAHDPSIVQAIHAHGWNAGVGINPETPLECLTPYVDTIDHVLLMSVYPGFSGQPFVPAAIPKLAELNALKKAHHASWAIAMDGGIAPGNLGTLTAIGLDLAAAASSIFSTPDPVEALQALREAARTQI